MLSKRVSGWGGLCASACPFAFAVPFVFAVPLAWPFATPFEVGVGFSESNRPSVCENVWPGLRRRNMYPKAASALRKLWHVPRKSGELNLSEDVPSIDWKGTDTAEGVSSQVSPWCHTYS